MSITLKAKTKLSPKAYFRIIDFCTVTFAASITGYIFTGELDLFSVPLPLFFFLALLYLVFCGPSDEFASSCWNRATSLAFITMVALSWIIPYFCGFIAGFIAVFVGETAIYTFFRDLFVSSEDTTIAAGMAVFVISFQWQRWSASR